MVVATEPIPTGHVVVSASFDKEGDTMPTEGTLTLHIRDQAVGSAKIRTQPGKFSLAGEGLNIGRDSGEPVTDDYPDTAPWTFTGGTIKQVIIDVSGEPFIDLAREAAAMFARE
jgi:arylsulfatase